MDVVGCAFRFWKVFRFDVFSILGFSSWFWTFESKRAGVRLLCERALLCVSPSIRRSLHYCLGYWFLFTTSAYLLPPRSLFLCLYPQYAAAGCNVLSPSSVYLLYFPTWCIARSCASEYDLYISHIHYTQWYLRVVLWECVHKQRRKQYRGRTPSRKAIQSNKSFETNDHATTTSTLPARSSEFRHILAPDWEQLAGHLTDWLMRTAR